MSLLRADALNIPLADETVDLIVTSPPYFALRSYTDGGEHYDGQIGSEATPQDFLDALWAVTAECKRVLKPTGSMFVNLGDSYENKSLQGLPWRYAIGCVDNLGLILRAEIVWSKPNCLSGGTKVYARTDNTRVHAIRLHDLCRVYQPGDVELWNGRRWTRVLWWQPTDRANTERPLEIEPRSGERVGCTAEHRWPVVGIGNVRADAIQAGDVIETCPMPEGDKRPARVDDADIGWFVGVYLADGSRSQGTIQVASHADAVARHKRLAELADSYGERCTTYKTKGNTATTNMTGRFLDAVLATFVGGTDAYTKHLKPEVWSRSNGFLAAVFDGYLECDAHDPGDGRVKIAFTGRNDELAENLRCLAARLGWSLRLRRGKAEAFGRWWPTWAGSLYRDPSRRRRPDSEVVAVRPSRARQFWDVGVEDDPHLFALASGVLTHNSLPESVTDRVRRSHEQWFHLTKQPRYFAAVDEVREPQVHGVVTSPGARRHVGGGTAEQSGAFSKDGGFNDYRKASGVAYNPLGKLPGSVWTVPSEPLVVPEHLGVDHFAAFPQEFPRRLILGWSPSGICTACGEGRRPVSERKFTGEYNTDEGRRQRARAAMSGGTAKVTLGRTDDITRTITGYVCACPDTSAPTRPAVVLDPFGGTGTVAMVARALGRYPVHIDLSADYLRLARWRVYRSGHAGKTASRTNRERQGALW